MVKIDKYKYFFEYANMRGTLFKFNYNFDSSVSNLYNKKTSSYNKKGDAFNGDTILTPNKW